MSTDILVPGALTIAQCRQQLYKPCPIKLDDSAWSNIQRSRQVVLDKIANDEVVYGVNTGFGRLASSRIEESELTLLQRNLLLSHATGVGEYLKDSLVRLIMVLKINALSQGYSGIRGEVIELLIAMVNAEIYPCIPEKGSVGASGDLAPLAHLSLPLIGAGEVRVNGEILAADLALQRAGLKPVVLQAKEGLALLNGTQVSTALALAGYCSAMQSLNAALVAGSMTVEAALASRVPFDARIHEVRGQLGQGRVAKVYRELLGDSEIAMSHLGCAKVQDPYSLRCQPQVMGACLDQLDNAGRILSIEANAISDNPLIFSGENGAADDILSGGNFHAQPVAFAADNMALAIAEIGSLSERRLALMLDSGLSQLPPFLVADAGVNSGFMIAQVTAAALVSENKALCYPGSVDSIPTSANQEDHVSMATYSARRLTAMNLNLRYVVAIELLAACQGIELRRPLQSNPVLEGYWQAVRKVVDYWDHDRYFQPDLEVLERLILDDCFGQHIALV